MGLLLGKALAFLGSKLGAYVVMGGLAAAIAAFAWYIWTDREALQLEVQAERAKVETLAATNASGERAIRHLEAQHKADEAATRAVLDRRTADALSLAQQLASLREIPDDPSCPLPAPIRGALDLMRQP